LCVWKTQIFFLLLWKSSSSLIQRWRLSCKFRSSRIGSSRRSYDHCINRKSGDIIGLPCVL
jgi:hypothetical protein